MSSLYIDQKYALILGAKLLNFKQLKTNLYLFSHDCEDKSKSRVRARAYIYLKGHSLMVKCHHCGMSHRLPTFMKQVAPSLLEEYDMEMFKEKSMMGLIRTPVPVMNQPKPAPRDDVLVGLKSLKELPPSHPAVLYSERRAIPRKYFKEIFFVPKFNSFASKIEPRFLNIPKDKEHPRLLFPYFDEQGKVFALAARAFGKEEPKYISLTLDQTKDRIYGMWRIDTSKTIYAVEGQIDSLCIDNAIAVGGADYGASLLQVHKDKLVIVPDNDFVRNKQVADSLYKAIKGGFSVALFPDTFKYKDLNEAAKKNFDSAELQRIIDSNVKRGAEAELELIFRRKC